MDSLSERGDAYYYTVKDSAYFYFDRVYDLAKADRDNEQLIQSLFNLSGVASYHYDLKKMGVSLTRLDSIFKNNTKVGKPDSKENATIYLYYKGDYQLKLFEYDNSIQTFEQIVDAVKKTPDSLQTPTLSSLSSAAYSFLGKIHMIEGKYDLAKQLYNQNIRNILHNDPEDLESLYGNYRLLSEVYRNENKFFEANQSLLKTFQYNKDKGNTNTVITSAFSIAENYNQLSQKDSALYYLSEARSHLNDNPLFYPKYHLGKSKIHRKNGEYELALYELQKCIDEVRQRLGDIKNSDLPVAYNEIGNIYKDLGNYELALKNYDLGLKVLSANSERDIYSVNLLKNKSDVLNLMDSETSYKASLNIVDLGNSILDSLKPSFKNNSDKLFLIENAFPLFESGIEAAYQLYTTKNDASYVDLAFLYSEKSKSVLLLEALLGAKATQFANIPEDVLERERQLKSEITYLEKQTKNSDEDEIEQDDALFDLKEEYRQLVRQLEHDYKSYYDLKYNTTTITLPEARKALTKNELLVSYFYGNNAIYIISLDSNDKKMSRVPIDPQFESTIKQVHQMLSDPKSDVAALGRATNEIYVRLLEPILTSDHQNKLIIIADGLLNYIPFAALNTDPKGITYLAESHAISYVNSATLLSKLQQRQPKAQTVLAFAPNFDGTVASKDRGKLQPLPNNKKEVEEILASFNGQAFMDEDATLKNFKSQLSSFGMVHLATHAIFDDTAPEYSYLAFAQNGNTAEDLLYVADLYNLQIKANLVTLSACESGIGELKRGEGFMSLARGFFYSGASSIASTLWKVNDASSSQLMSGFYKNLSDGDTKDLALQKTQVDFLNANRQNGLSHPYYWSGFIISGNIDPVIDQSHWVQLLLGALFAALVGFLLYRKFQRV